MAMQSQSKASETPEDVKKMYDILKRIESNELNDSGSDLSELSDEELDSDDADDSVEQTDLSIRLKGIDLNDADAVWSKLSESERQEFQKIIQSEDVTSILPKFSAWWEIQIKRTLVTEMNGDEKAEPTVEHPKIIDGILDFEQISTKPPAECVGNNLTNVLAGYSSMVRYFYGEYESNVTEAIDYLIAICANLRTNANFDDSDLAVESIRQDAINEGYSIDRGDIRQIKKDVEQLTNGPIENQSTNTFALAALSDLHRLLTAAKTEIKSTKSKTKTSSSNSTAEEKDSDQKKSENDQFSKRFSDHKSALRLEKSKLTAMIKKIEFYLAYVKKYHQ